MLLQRIASSRPGLLEPIDESPDVIHQRRRDRAISFERIRQQTQERIYEVRDRISRIDQRITGDRFQIQITDSPQEIGQSEVSSVYQPKPFSLSILIFKENIISMCLDIQLQLIFLSLVGNYRCEN